jgi:hypothetical protein
MTIPVLVPAATLSLLVGHMNERYLNAPIGRAIQRGLAPITIGLMCASATVLMRAVNHDWRGYLLTLATVCWSCAPDGALCGCSPPERSRASWVSCEKRVFLPTCRRVV